MAKYMYMCNIDYIAEIGLGELGPRHPTPLYSTIEDLKKDHDCWPECGIVKVEITLIEGDN